MGGDVGPGDRTDTTKTCPAVPSRAILAITALFYAALVMLMWAPYTLHSGFGYETAFPYMSENGSLWEGFLYRSDPLRIHTNTFYHFGYLLGEAFGVGGSYVPYQIVHATLWWARGFLVFLLLSRLVPAPSFIPYVAGALVLVHASDGALQWVGQMNQFGFIFWMLLAFFMLVKALEARRRTAIVALAASACFFEYMSLWSYESQIGLLVVVPVLLFACRRTWRRRLAPIAAGWYAVPAIYLFLTFQKYTSSGGGSYQESVLRNSWSPAAIASDWWFNISSSVAFWDWVRSTWSVPLNVPVSLALIAVAVFVAGAWALSCYRPEPARADWWPLVRAWTMLLGVGLLLLISSFPVYLVLNSARGLWRTQLLSGVGAGVVLTAAIGLVCHFAPARLRPSMFVGVAGIVVFVGSLAALQLGAFHRSGWERHRAAIRKVLEAAPSVKPGTLIVLTNVDKADDPFGHNMWLDVALRLAYPRIPVAGIYFYDDKTPSPGNNVKMKGDAWVWDGTGFPPAVQRTSVTNTVVVDRSARSAPLAEFPAFVCESACPDELYQPSRVVIGSLPVRAARRYRVYQQTSR